jgi:hypothetical protein
MEQEAIKALLYGGIQELIRNRRYYYFSSVGSQYSHWTEEGTIALAEYMNLISHKMVQSEEALLNKRAKELVIKGLKGETI